MMSVRERYYEKFHELPLLPKMVNIGILEDEMEDAIIRGTPLTQEEINKIVSKIDEPIDINF